MNETPRSTMPNWYYRALALAEKEHRNEALAAGDQETARAHALQELRAYELHLAVADDREAYYVRRRIAGLRIATGDFDGGMAEWEALAQEWASNNLGKRERIGRYSDDRSPSTSIGVEMLVEAAEAAAAIGEPRAAALAALDVMKRRLDAPITTRSPRWTARTGALNPDSPEGRSSGLLRQLAAREPLVVRPLLDAALDGDGGLRERASGQAQPGVTEGSGAPSGRQEVMKHIAALEQVRGLAAHAVGDKEGSHRASQGRTIANVEAASNGAAVAPLNLDRVVRSAMEHMRGVDDPADIRAFRDSLPPETSDEPIEIAVARMAVAVAEAATGDAMFVDGALQEAQQRREAIEARIREETLAKAREIGLPMTERTEEVVSHGATAMTTGAYRRALTENVSWARRENIGRLVTEGEPLLVEATPESVRQWAFRVAQGDRTPDGGFGEHAVRAVVLAQGTTDGLTTNTTERETKELFDIVVGATVERGGLERTLETIGALEEGDVLRGHQQRPRWSALRAASYEIALERSPLAELERDELMEHAIAEHLEAAYPEQRVQPINATANSGVHAFKGVQASRYRLRSLLADEANRSAAVRALGHHVMNAPGKDQLGRLRADPEQRNLAEVVAMFDGVMGEATSEEERAQSVEVHEEFRRHVRTSIGTNDPNGAWAYDQVRVLLQAGAASDALWLARETLAGLDDPGAAAKLEQRLPVLEGLNDLARGDLAAAARVAELIESQGDIGSRELFQRILADSPRSTELIAHAGEVEGPAVAPLFPDEVAFDEAALRDLFGLDEADVLDGLSAAPDLAFGGHDSIDEGAAGRRAPELPVDDLPPMDLDEGRTDVEPSEGVEDLGPEVDGPEL